MKFLINNDELGCFDAFVLSYNTFEMKIIDFVRKTENLFDESE